MNDTPKIFEAAIVRRIHEGLTLDVAIALDAECGVIFGKSGAGKTSLLRLIAGLDRPESGFVRVGDSLWFDSAKRISLPLRSRHAGVVFQDDLLFPHMSVDANMRFGLHAFNRAEANRRVDEIGSLCGVSHLRDRRPTTLSGGERQRVGLARALAPRPKMLLCDEPVSAIDLEGRFTLVELLRKIMNAEKIPILYVTHSPAEAIALGSTLFALEGGRIVDRGPPLDVLARREAGRTSRIDEVRNIVSGTIARHAADRGETFVTLRGGPQLVVPYHDREPGASVTITVRADDILLARGPVAGLSARNIIAGSVTRIVPHGADAEVLVAAGETSWIVSVVGPAVDALGLCAGVEVRLIFKARSCNVR